MHKPTTWVSHGIEVFTSFGQVGGKSVEVLDFDTIDFFVIVTVVFFNKLVIFFILVFLFAEPIVVELLFVNAVDDEQVVFDFFFEAQGQGVLSVGFEVTGCLDLIIFLFEFAEYFVAVYEVRANFFFQIVFPGYTFLKQIFEHVIIVGNIWVVLDGL